MNHYISILIKFNKPILNKIWTFLPAIKLKGDFDTGSGYFIYIKTGQFQLRVQCYQNLWCTLRFMIIILLYLKVGRELNHNIVPVLKFLDIWVLKINLTILQKNWKSVLCWSALVQTKIALNVIEFFLHCLFCLSNHNS